MEVLYWPGRVEDGPVLVEPYESIRDGHGVKMGSLAVVEVRVRFPYPLEHWDAQRESRQVGQFERKALVRPALSEVAHHRVHLVYINIWVVKHQSKKEHAVFPQHFSSYALNLSQDMVNLVNWYFCLPWGDSRRQHRTNGWVIDVSIAIKHGLFTCTIAWWFVMGSCVFHSMDLTFVLLIHLTTSLVLSHLQIPLFVCLSVYLIGCRFVIFVCMCVYLVYLSSDSSAWFVGRRECLFVYLLVCLFVGGFVYLFLGMFVY